MLNFPGISSSWDIERETRRRRLIGKLKSGIHIRDDGGEFHFRWHVENSPSILASLRREKPTERKMSLAGERVASFVLLVTPPKSFMRANLRLFVLNLSTRSTATFPAFPYRDSSRDLSVDCSFPRLSYLWEWFPLYKNPRGQFYLHRVCLTSQSSLLIVTIAILHLHDKTTLVYFN